MKKKLWILALPFAVCLLVAATVNKYFGQFTGTFFGDGAGVTNVVSTNLLAGTNLWTGTNTWTVGTRTLKHGGTTTVITNTTTLTSTEWGDGFEKHWYNGTNFVSIQKTNGNMIVGGSLTVSNGLTLKGPGGGISVDTNLSIVGTLTSEGSTLWGNSAHTNGVTVNRSGQILSNALGTVTISSGNITNTGTIASGGFMSPTNGVLLQVKPSFTTNFTCTTNIQFYCLNNLTTTPQIITLPNAANVPGLTFTFSSTNQAANFIITNATGAQTIANGTYLSYTNSDNGIKTCSFISDGAAWWLTRKSKITLPSASFSCSTNTTFPNVTNMVTLNTTDMTTGTGIALDNSGWATAGVGSRIWVTNAGTYMLMFSAMWSKTGGGSANGDIWLRQNGAIIPNTATIQTVQNSTSTNVMAVSFLLPVTNTCYFDLVGASPDGTAQLQALPAITTPFARPAAPSIIVTINKTSDNQ